MITSYQEYTEALADGRDELFIGEAMLGAVFGDLQAGCNNLVVAVESGLVVACRVERQSSRARIIEVMEFESPGARANVAWLEQVYSRPTYDAAYDSLPISDDDASTFADLNRRVMYFVEQLGISANCFIALSAAADSAPLRHLLGKISCRCPKDVALGNDARRLEPERILFDHVPTLYAGMAFEASFGHEFAVVIPTTGETAEILVGGVPARRAHYRASIDAMGNIANDITSSLSATRTVSLRPDIFRRIELKPLSNIQA